MATLLRVLALLLAIAAGIYCLLSREELTNAFKEPEADSLGAFGCARELKCLQRRSVQLKAYVDGNQQLAVAQFLSLYVFLNAFSIPGATGLNLLAGALFTCRYDVTLGAVTAPTMAFALVLGGATLGAMGAFLLSRSLLSELFADLFPQHLAGITEEARTHADSQFLFGLGLRLSPIFPNFATNVLMPLVGVDVGTFFLFSLVGLAPRAMIDVAAGKGLLKLANLADAVTTGSTLLLFLLSVLALIPVYSQYSRKLAARIEEDLSPRAALRSRSRTQ